MKWWGDNSEQKLKFFVFLIFMNKFWLKCKTVLWFWGQISERLIRLVRRPERVEKSVRYKICLENMREWSWNAGKKLRNFQYVCIGGSVATQGTLVVNKWLSLKKGMRMQICSIYKLRHNLHIFLLFIYKIPFHDIICIYILSWQFKCILN